jgi:hypothetical protein
VECGRSWARRFRLRHAELAGLRKWSVNGLQYFLTLSMPRSDGVSVVRVLHASREMGTFRTRSLQSREPQTDIETWTWPCLAVTLRISPLFMNPIR